MTTSYAPPVTGPALTGPALHDTTLSGPALTGPALTGPALDDTTLMEPVPTGADAATGAPETTDLTALARRLSRTDLVDADDVIAELESLGVSDRTARERYGMPSVFSLGEAVMTHLRYGRTAVRGHRGVRRAPSRRQYLVGALLRCALYVGPLSVAVAAAGPLTRVPWQVPAMVVLLGWSAAQALTAVGLPVARRAGRAAAARLVGGGFTAVAGAWCALVWVAPGELLGPDRLLAAVLGIGGLATLATVAGALVTRAETAVIRWSLPVWLLAAITVAGAWPPHVPGHALLGLAVAAATIRAFRPALGRPGRNRPGRGRPERSASARSGASRREASRRTTLTVAELRRGFCYAIIGAAQAVSVALLWRTGPPGVTPPAILPLLAAVPMLEALVGWHAGQVEAGLDGAESGPAYAEHLRGVTVVTVAGLLPPLCAGVALAAAAYRLPYGLSAQTGARDLVLSLAGGTLLGGVVAVTLLLAERGRTATAATLAAAVPLLTAVAHALPGTSLPTGPDLLPTVVAILAVTLLVGLPAVATALDHRRTS